MCESQPREVWSSSQDLISVPFDKDEPTSRVSKKFNKTGALRVQRVEASVSVVWSLVRRFDEPQIYKHFVGKCSIRGEGDLKVKVGCLKEVQVVSGLPAATSTERLDILDEEQHILSFSIVGGDHRAEQYRSITNLQETIINGKPGTSATWEYQ